MKLIKTKFPSNSDSSVLGSGDHRIRFAKACVVGFCEFWGFLPCFYDPVSDQVVYRPSIRWIVILCTSTLLKSVTFVLFVVKIFRKGQLEVTHGVTVRLFMFKLNLFTGFVHLHTAWKGAEMFSVTNRMAAGFRRISLELKHSITKKTGSMMCVFFAMLATLSVSTLHPFLMDCSFHFIEEILGSCQGQRSYNGKFAFEVITQFLSGADLCGSILPYGIILTEFILMPREILTEMLQKSKNLKTGSNHVIPLLNIYDSLGVIFSHFNQTFHIFMPALVNFLITSVSYTLACMILRGTIAFPIKVTMIIYFVMIFLRLIIIMDQSSKISMDSARFLQIIKKKSNNRNRPIESKWMNRKLKSLKTLEVRIGEFHSVSTYVMFISLNAVISYTVSILLTSKQMLQR